MDATDRYLQQYFRINDEYSVAVYLKNVRLVSTCCVHSRLWFNLGEIRALCHEVYRRSGSIGRRVRWLHHSFSDLRRVLCYF